MCLIIAKPKGYAVPDEWMENAWEHNDDSLGMSYFDDSGICRTHKWVNPSRGRLRKAIKLLSGLTDRPVLIHFRYSTHGKTDEANCHPFPLNGRAVIAHNGIIPGFVCKRGVESDTAMYVRRVLRPLVTEFGVDAILNNLDSLTKKDIGASKLCALDCSGQFHFANENDGAWKDGMWVSNTYSIRSATDYDYLPTRYRDTDPWIPEENIWCKKSGRYYKCPPGYRRWWDSEEWVAIPEAGEGPVLTLDDLKDIEHATRKYNHDNWEWGDDADIDAFKDDGVENDFELAIKWGCCAQCGQKSGPNNYCDSCYCTTTSGGVIFGPPLPRDNDGGLFLPVRQETRTEAKIG